jgi:hypothetical protein
MLDDRTLFADWILEAVGKRATAIATVQEMVEWFAKHYEDPAESTPYCSEEGGYMYLCGGPYDAREEIEAHFAGKQGAFSADECDAITAAAAAEVEEDGIDVWAKVIDDPEPEPDDDPEPDDNDPEPDDNDPELNDDVVRLLRTHDHYYGVGHVHQFRISLGKTLCGRKLENCPGDLDWGTADAITCKACLNTLRRGA